MTGEWSYKIVDGKIIADDPGRPGKPSIMLSMKTPEQMILKGSIRVLFLQKTIMGNRI